MLLKMVHFDRLKVLYLGEGVAHVSVAINMVSQMGVKCRVRVVGFDVVYSAYIVFCYSGQMKEDTLGVLGFLMLFPVVAAVVQMVVKGETARTVATYVSSGTIAIAAIIAAVLFMGKSVYFAGSSEIVSLALTIVDLGIAALITYYAVKYKRPAVIALAVAQAVLILVFEVFIAPHVEVASALYIDTLSVIMVLIIGIIGSGIIVYALGYMADFKAEHADEPDRRPRFFAIMYIFLAGMFLIAFSNNLAWVLCGWEITTVCSFLLIGYTRTEEAINNAFRQIWMNLIGGLAFSIALMILGMCGTVELNVFVAAGQFIHNAPMTMVASLLALAAITKAAQMPFHTWLLGAMVAPTPTSALLHSSTMVKAGCFLLIKLSPVFASSLPGLIVMLVGMLTFMLASMIAITQSNAKRVLAYSTIANLGLIVACAGIGSTMAVWAAIFLLVFHACAKSLLFLCVGTAEHHIGSRDIEDMDALFERMPRLARLMSIGILIMFIAPFGMLISKWAAFQAFIVDGNLLVVLMLAFGSAATFFFWAKWLGKITATAQGVDDIEGTVHPSEWQAMGLMAFLAIACTFAFPLIATYVVDPYLGFQTGIATDNLWLLAILSLAVIVVMLGIIGRPSRRRLVAPYLGGAGIDPASRTFNGSLEQPVVSMQRNWYLEAVFPQERLTMIGEVVSALLIIFGLAISFASLCGIGGGF